MKLVNVLLNLAKKIKTTLSSAKSYTDSKISPINTRLTKVEAFGTLVNSIQKQGKNQTITIPNKSTWRIMLVTAYVAINNTNIVYQNVIFKEQTFADTRLFLGGYYSTTSDRGLCNVNLYMPDDTGGTISLRNFLYANSDYGSSAYLQVRFYK